MKSRLMLLVCSAALVAGCNDTDSAADRAEDKLEASAESSAQAAGSEEAALGLTEAQLLDADLRGADGSELGDVAQVVRSGDGAVEKLLIEIEDSQPDRFVHVPIAGLTTVKRGTDTDLSTTMTKEDLTALPEVKLPAS
jgi:hypothetical protein